MQPFIATLGPIADLLPDGERTEFTQALDMHGRRCVRPRVPVDQLPFDTHSVPWTERGRFLVDSAVRPGSYLSFAAGDFFIQDAASLLPIELMQLQPGQSVIDCCAAPGGKSAAVLDQFAGNGLLVSNEVIASRIDTLQLTLARTGYWNYLLTHHNVERLAESLAEQFDCVLVDAPCSGQSLVGRGKQSMSAFSEHQVAHSAARQQTILQSALQLVRPGGRLVYSTCTFAYAENEGIVAWLRERLPAWQPLQLEHLAQWQTPGFPGCYRLWPHRDHCAGGFAAALVRPAHQSSDSLMPWLTPSSASSATLRRAQETWQPTGDENLLNEWGVLNDPSQLYALGRRPLAPVSSDKASSKRRPATSSSAGSSSNALNALSKHQQLTLFDSRIPDAWRSLAYCGIEAATRFGEHWQPAYPIAVFNAPSELDSLNALVSLNSLNTSGSSSAEPLFKAHQVTELSDHESCMYFTGTSIHRPGPEGWQVVTWRDRPLGWAKQVGGQLKNHLPKPLRQPNLII